MDYDLVSLTLDDLHALRHSVATKIDEYFDAGIPVDICENITEELEKIEDEIKGRNA